MTAKATALAVAFIFWASVPLAQTTHVVVMGGDAAGDAFRFHPEITRIETGDTVLFKAVDHLHGSQSILEMCPDLDTSWRGELGRNVEITFERPGIYGFKCPAHYSLGMVGVVVVGNGRPNLVAALAKKHPPAAAAAFRRLLDQIATEAAAKEVGSLK